MAQFLDLPLEILPFILQHIVRPNYLTQLSLVNSHFHEFATPLLYRRAFVYAWHREAKAKVLKLFGTLAAYPRLARYVEQLAIRDFPRALSPTEQDKILDMCLQAIRNCTNLRSCTWTRDGSLSTELLQAFCDVPHLSELEINGHSDRFYDHRILCRFSHLQQITLIMPSSSVVDILPTWVSHCDRLQHLTLICKSSHLLNDSILEEMAPNLVQLRHLYLVGCPKVTSVGLWAVLSANQDGLHGLGLEGLSPDFDIQRLSELCRSSGALRLLQSVTLALGNTKQTRHKNWSSEIPRLLEASPLEMFHVSSLGGEVGVDVSDDLCAAIISDHGHRLKRFSVHRMRVSPVAVEDICHRCVNLEQLFVTMEQDSLDNLGPILSLAPKLKALHIHRPVGMVIGGKGPVVTQEQALRIVKHCTWDLEQIGFNTRVWQIERVPQTQENGVISFVPRLGPYESPEIPEQFLVVRT